MIKKKLRNSASPPKVRRPSRRVALVFAFSLVLLIGGGLVFADWWSTVPDDVTPTYVGRQSCVQCHRQQYELWQGSHHDLAMDIATDATVLGDFDNAELQHFDVTSRFYRQDGKFMVHTEGPDGELGEFEVKYVLGVTPLQQYMIEFDRPDDMPAHEIARLQVLRLCWDTEREEWFYLPPPDVDEKLPPDDVLHWTGVTMRWNTSCADCHSTNLQKNYDVDTQTFHTTFSEIDVSCEACHGPGSLHVELAESRSLFWDRKRGYGLAKLKDTSSRPQIDTCATCHSRRQASLAADFRPGENFYDYHANALLSEGLYYADGQILDEVYVHGSFLQSKMYHKGIRCTDCHDPHSTRLLHNGNQVCTSCHQHSAGKYDAVQHHHHDPGTIGASCVECHMPSRTYMEVDPRRDHSIRVPRPDLSVQLGTPNACSGCHLDQGGLDPQRQAELSEYADWLEAAAAGDEEVSAALDRVNEWSNRWFTEWYGVKEDASDHFALALAGAREGDPAAADELIRVASDRREAAIVRATCVFELGQYGSEKSRALSLDLLDDPEPQVRAAALANLQDLPADRLVRAAVPLLDDPMRLVRTEAARLLARLSPADIRGSDRRRLREVLEEVEAGWLVNNDRAGAHLMLGVLHTDQGDFEQAIRDYETAMELEPLTVGPRSNMAELLERRAVELESAAARSAQSGDPRGQQFMQTAFQLRNRVATLRREELDLLARDVQLVPNNAQLRYRYGLLLYLHNREAEAEEQLATACRLAPNAPEFAMALALLYQKQERYGEALDQARRMLELRPEDPIARRLVDDLRQQANGTGGVPAPRS